MSENFYANTSGRQPRKNWWTDYVAQAHSTWHSRVKTPTFDKLSIKKMLVCYRVGERVKVWTGSEDIEGTIIDRRCYACRQVSLAFVTLNGSDLPSAAFCVNGCEPKGGAGSAPSW